MFTHNLNSLYEQIFTLNQIRMLRLCTVNREKIGNIDTSTAFFLGILI